jgi:hypothetical protein
VSPPAPLERERVGSDGEPTQLGPPRSVHRRRARAVRARRRRLLVLDLLLAVALALAAVAIAPGLAVVAIVAVLVLLTCGASLLYGRLRRWRAARRSPPRD